MPSANAVGCQSRAEVVKMLKDDRVDLLALGFATCGVDSLDRYFRDSAGQDFRRLANGVFVLVEQAAPEVVLGYYTLCATSLSPGDVPEGVKKHIPRYPLVSATLIGRLAISAGMQGQRLGAILLER